MMIRNAVAVVLAAGALMVVGCEEKKPATPAPAKSTAEKAAGAVKDAAKTTGDAVKAGAEKTGEAVKAGAEATKDAAKSATEAAKAALPDVSKSMSEWTGKVDALVKQVSDMKAPASLPAPAAKLYEDGKAALLKQADAVKAEIAKLKDAKPEGAKGLLDGIPSKFGELQKAVTDFAAKKWDAATAPAAPAAPGAGK